MNNQQSQNNDSTKAQCKTCIYKSPSKPTQILKKQKKYECSKYQYPLDIIRKGELIVDGYMRKYKFYIKELIKIIYAFYFIEILNYKIKAIGYNMWGQQGVSNRYGNPPDHVTILTTVKTYHKMIQNIINGCQNIYILFTDSTYECCGYNKYGQLGINMDSYGIKSFVQNNNIKINNIFSSAFSYHAFCIDNNNNIYACGENYNNKWTQINTQIQIQKIATGNGYTTFINDNAQLFVCGNDSYGWGVLGLGKGTKEVKKITKIPIQTKFIDIYCGWSHTLALDCNGQIWSWGNGLFGELGHGDTNNRYKPTKVEYFMNITITQICCGQYHNVVLSNANKIYTFGKNEEYQCGNNNNKNVLIPEVNETLKNENIITIKCGSLHNMVKNNKNEYYLWGYNKDNICLVISNNLHIYNLLRGPSNVKKPLLLEWKHFVNENEQIIDIFLGYSSTRILIGNTKESTNL